MSIFSEYIGSQFGNPRGVVGGICTIIMNVLNRSMYQSVVENIQLNQDSYVLDVGYGNGYLIQKIYKKFSPNILGIDISEDMKIKATKKNKKGVNEDKVKLLLGDCCQLDFKEGYFDAVTTVNTIYFWQDTKKGLSEIHRVLKEGGSFYNAIYSKEWLQKLSYTRKGFKFFEVDELQSLGKQVGFSEIEVKKIVNGKNYLVVYKK